MGVGGNKDVPQAVQKSDEFAPLVDSPSCIRAHGDSMLVEVAKRDGRLGVLLSGELAKASFMRDKGGGMRFAFRGGASFSFRESNTNSGRVGSSSQAIGEDVNEASYPIGSQ